MTIALLWVEKVPYQMKWGLYDLDNKLGHDAYIEQRCAIMDAIRRRNIKIFWEIFIPKEQGDRTGTIQKIYQEPEE